MKQSLLEDAAMIEERTRELARKKLRVGLLAGGMPLGIYERGCLQVLL